MNLLWFLCFGLLHVCVTVSPNSQHVNLQERRVTLSYRKTLNKAFDAFRDWCYLHGHKHPDDYGRNPELMNEALVEHVQFLFDEGKAQ